jgi:exoribonuclease II
LGIAPGSPADAVARRRLSTVYMPGAKITMLPDPLIEAFTLKENRAVPAVSLYFTVSPEDGAVLRSETRLERIRVAANLRHDELEQVFNDSALQVAKWLEALRGKAEAQPPPMDYSFYVEGGRVRIVPRPRGSPMDRLVSELMIAANSSWGKVFADHGIAAIYRTQGNGKVLMSLEPGPHAGLGVEQYTWTSSPLRRYVDLINQRQLVAWLRHEVPVYHAQNDELAAATRAFEIAHEAYTEFQRGMERYWCLRYLTQEHIVETAATVLRESLVRLDGLPLVCRVPSLPTLAQGTPVKVALSNIDEWDLTLGCQFKGKLA